MQEITTIPQRAEVLMVALRAICFIQAGVNREPSDIHLAALEINEEQEVVGHQSAQRQHLGGEEVGSRQQRHVGPNEGGPRGRALAFRCWQHTVASQNIANCLIGNLAPQIGQRPRNPVMAPVPVLASHANDQFLDLSLDARSARTSTDLRAVEFSGWASKRATASVTPPGACGTINRIGRDGQVSAEAGPTAAAIRLSRVNIRPATIRAAWPTARSLRLRWWRSAILLLSAKLG
jgi:hypothetical protein